MAKLHLSESGMSFSLTVTDEIFTEYLKTDVSEMNISQKLALLNNIKKELKFNVLEILYLSPIGKELKIHLKGKLS